MITFTDAWRRAAIHPDGTMTILAHKTSSIGWTVALPAPTRILHVDARTLEFQPVGAHQVAALANLGHQLLQEITAYRPGFAWKSTPAEIIGALAEEVHESAGTQAGDRLGPLLAAIHDGVPLEEPVSVCKAMMARRKAHVVLHNGTGPMAAVHLVNIGVGGWTHNETTATAYANGFNRGAEWLRSSIIEYAYTQQQTKAMKSVSAAISDVIAERRQPAGRLTDTEIVNYLEQNATIHWDWEYCYAQFEIAGKIINGSLREIVNATVSAPSSAIQKSERAELDAAAIANRIVRDVAELDRDSPADQPAMMLVTADELQAIVIAAIDGGKAGAS